MYSRRPDWMISLMIQILRSGCRGVARSRWPQSRIVNPVLFGHRYAMTPAPRPAATDYLSSQGKNILECVRGFTEKRRFHRWARRCRTYIVNQIGGLFLNHRMFKNYARGTGLFGISCHDAREAFLTIALQHRRLQVTEPEDREIYLSRACRFSAFHCCTPPSHQV